MQKNYVLILVLIGISFNGIAQMPAATEIKKLKIKKITSQDQANSSAAGRTEWYYNNHGDDTATFRYGKRSNYKIIEYDTKQRIKTVKEFSDAGAERETTVYTYKPDGSFVSVNTDKQFGMKNTIIYDTKGREISHTIPDGSIWHSVYNSKGQLIKFYAEVKNGGMEINNLYTYNAKGQMVKEEKKGEYQAVNTFEYDAKGLLKKSINTTGSDSDDKRITVYQYSYEY